MNGLQELELIWAEEVEILFPKLLPISPPRGCLSLSITELGKSARVVLALALRLC